MRFLKPRSFERGFLLLERVLKENFWINKFAVIVQPEPFVKPVFAP